MLTTIREMWADGFVGRLTLACCVAIPAMCVWALWAEARNSDAFDACVRAGGTVAVSTSGERWCTRGGGR